MEQKQSRRKKKQSNKKDVYQIKEGEEAIKHNIKQDDQEKISEKENVIDINFENESFQKIEQHQEDLSKEKNIIKSGEQNLIVEEKSIEINVDQENQLLIENQEDEENEERSYTIGGSMNFNIERKEPEQINQDQNQLQIIDEDKEEGQSQIQINQEDQSSDDRQQGQIIDSSPIVQIGDNEPQQQPLLIQEQEQQEEEEEEEHDIGKTYNRYFDLKLILLVLKLKDLQEKIKKGSYTQSSQEKILFVQAYGGRYSNDEVFRQNFKEYKIINQRLNQGDEIFYNIEHYDKKYYPFPIELREIFVDDIIDFEKILYHLICFKNGLQNYQGLGEDSETQIKSDLQGFLQIFEFWSGWYQGKYILIFIEEKLKHLKEAFNSLSTLTLNQQISEFDQILKTFAGNYECYERYGDLIYHSEMSLNNLFYRESSDKPVISFRKETLFTQSQLDTQKVKSSIDLRSSAIVVFKDFFNLMKEQKLSIMETLPKFQEQLVSQQNLENISPLLKQGDRQKYYKIVQQGEVIDNYVIYKQVKSMKSNKVYQIKEIHCLNQDDLELVMKNIKNYIRLYSQITNYGDKLYFQNVHDMWADEKNIIYVVEGQVKNSLMDFLELNKITDVKEINQAIYMLSYICYNPRRYSGIPNYTGFNPENIGFIEDPWNLSKLHPVFSYKYKNQYFKGNQNHYKEYENSIFLFIYDILQTVNEDNLKKHFKESDIKKQKINKIDNYHVGKKESISLEQESQVQDLLFIRKYETPKCLGQGAFGQVFSIINERGRIIALKQLKNKMEKNFTEIIKSYQEASFGLLLAQGKFLLEIYDVFLVEEIDKFLVNISMQLGSCDLIKLKPYKFKKYKKLNLLIINGKPFKKDSFTFQDLFPLIKDTIFGLCHIHLNNIAHRDIKPENIMVLIKYLIADFGEGINLNYEESIDGNIEYQKGNFKVQGTPSFMDPEIYQAYLESKRQKINFLCQDLDLFKTDIYSLGISLIYFASGNESVKKANREDKNSINRTIDKLNFPIQVKNIFKSMVQFQSSNRIPTFSLYTYLKTFMEQLEKGLQFLSPLLSISQKIKFSNQIGINNLYKHGRVFKQRQKIPVHKFKHKIRNISEEQSFNCSHFKMVTNRNIQLENGQIILLKPTYFPSFVIEDQGDKMLVSVAGKSKKVNKNRVITVKIPIYQIGQPLLFFNENANKWELSMVENIKDSNYEIFCSTSTQQINLTVPFNSLKLKPIVFFDTQDLFDQDYKLSKKRPIIVESEKRLLNYDSPLLDTNSLFEQKCDLEEIGGTKKFKESYLEYKEHSVVRRKLDIVYDNKFDAQDQMLEFLKQSFQPELLFSRINYKNLSEKSNCDLFGEVKFNFQNLKAFLMSCAFFNNQDSLKSLLTQLAHARSLKKLELVGLTFQNGRDLPIKKKYILSNVTKIIRNTPLTDLKIFVEPHTESNVIVPISTFVELFDSLSSKKMERVSLILTSFQVEDNTKEQMKNLKTAFSDLLKMLNKFWFLDLRLNFIGNKKVEIDVFEEVVEFVKINKQMIGMLEEKWDFIIEICVADVKGLVEIRNKIREIIGQSVNIKYECATDKGGYVLLIWNQWSFIIFFCNILDQTFYPMERTISKLYRRECSFDFLIFKIYIS